jgi:hypothetical protein
MANYPIAMHQPGQEPITKQPHIGFGIAAEPAVPMQMIGELIHYHLSSTC